MKRRMLSKKEGKRLQKIISWLGKNGGFIETKI